MCTTEQLVDFSDQKCGRNHIEWMSLMRVFGIPPPPKLSVDRSFAESPCSVVSSIPSRAMSKVDSSQRDVGAGSCDEEPEESSYGAAGQSSAWEETLLRSSEHEQPNLDSFWFGICQDRKRGETHVTKRPHKNRGDVGPQHVTWNNRIRR